MIKLGLVLPCYNEEEIICDSINILLKLFNNLKNIDVISSGSFLCFVDDGSVDKTWLHIQDKIDENRDEISGIKLSRNFGHQNAILAGMNYCKDQVDCCITMDVDLQDDINVIEQMVNSFKEGNEIVYGVRSIRKSDSFFKRWTAEMYYYLLNALSIKSIHNHADFRLLSSKSLNVIYEYNESNLFLRGLIPSIGFKSSILSYERLERTKGETKYTLKKMLSLAWEGITSFSVFPLKLITICGTIAIIGSLIALLWILFSKMFGNTVSGWTSLAASIYLIGGVQLLFLGIIGEYVGKIYLESKRRPRYIIEKVI